MNADADADPPDDGPDEASPRSWSWRRRLAFGGLLFAVFHLAALAAARDRADRVRALEALDDAPNGVTVGFGWRHAPTPAAKVHHWWLRRTGGGPGASSPTWKLHTSVRELTVWTDLSEGDFSPAEAAAWRTGPRPALRVARDLPDLTALTTAGPLPADLVAGVAAIPNLRRWSVTRVEDVSGHLAAAARSRSLRVLALDGAALTAADLDRLGACGQLTTVLLLDCTAPAGVDRAAADLRRSLPGAVVAVRFRPPPGDEW